jgi:hypothetical protein
MGPFSRVSHKYELMGLPRRFRFDEGLTGMARKTVEGCVERINQLYEQGADAIRIRPVRVTVAWDNSIATRTSRPPRRQYAPAAMIKDGFGAEKIVTLTVVVTPWVA